MSTQSQGKEEGVAMSWQEDSVLPGMHLFITELSQFNDSSPSRFSPSSDSYTHLASHANCTAAEGIVPPAIT